MSDIDDLDQMTLKDLRKIAGEKQVPNRSRLGKEDLLDQLKQVLQKTASVMSSSKTTPPKGPELLAPETIDPALKERPSRHPRHPRQDAEQAPRSIDKAPAKQESDGDAPSPDRDRDRSRDRDRHKDGDRDRDRGRDRGRDRNREGDRNRDRTSDGERDRNRDGDQDRRDTNRQRGPAKPALTGNQPKLPQAFDRLRQITQGILELCDPETPSWAQARLSELLGATGVVPTPCQGKPHPDFHEVLGNTETDTVAAGEICLIEAPGFCIRGDRGDLFCLRKAKVRIAAGGADDEDLESDGDTPDLEAMDLPALETDEADEADEADDALEDTDDDQDDTMAPADRGSPPAEPSPDDDDPTDRPVVGGKADDALGKPLAVAPEAPVATAVAAAVAAPARAERNRGRRSHHDRACLPEDAAPSLPLLPQEAEELGARPKAEGFRPLELNEQILADLAEIGYVTPQPIQAEAIPLAKAGKDLIGQALTGTGKTAAFILPILDRLYTAEGLGPIGLVLCPTRELARQVHSECVRMAGKSGARSIVIYGGVSMDDQFDQLGHHPHIVVGTPGRLIDHLRRKTLDLSRLATVVLDEADQMLDIGFLPDIEYILRHSPPERQTLLFSATMPEEIRRLANKYMHDPVTVDVMPPMPTVAEVDQKYIAVDQNRKTTLLAHFIDTQEPEQMLVFCRTKHQTDRVAMVLKGKRMSAAAIHGDMPQTKRERTLRDFRDRNLQCLIATNVAARGLDIPSVSHVVNYDVPETPEEYVHRIGRTARNGARGVARTFITPNDGQFLLEIEKHIGQLLDEEEIDGITASTATEVKRTIAATSSSGNQRLLKPLLKGIRLGRRRK